MDAPVESSSPQGPLISPTPSSGPRRERHSESAGLSGVTLSTPSAAVAPPLAVALLELPPPAPPAPPPLAAAPRRSVPPPVDISSRPFGRRDPLYAHRYTARPRGRTAANSATAPGVDASEPLMRGRSATCSSEGHLCFRCGGPPLASPVPRSRAHDTRRRTRTSLPNAPFRTSSWRFATLCPAPRVRSARWRSVPPPRVYSVWRLPPGLPLPRRRAPRARTTAVVTSWKTKSTTGRVRRSRSVTEFPAWRVTPGLRPTPPSWVTRTSRTSARCGTGPCSRGISARFAWARSATFRSDA